MKFVRNKTQDRVLSKGEGNTVKNEVHTLDERVWTKTKGHKN